MTRTTGVRVAFLALAASAALGVAVVGQQPGQQAAPAPVPVFTAAQAAAGRTAYDANCASCHLQDLAGRNEAPQLAGANFVNTWGARTVRDLFTYIRTSMPPAGAVSRQATHMRSPGLQTVPAPQSGSARHLTQILPLPATEQAGRSAVQPASIAPDACVLRQATHRC